ncbi:Six-hairpin glycosidase-like protein [Desarmillaria ectypa]|nr:Six-hairpin glycosidase-like protein [Desarmillaria ectypa]
MGFVSSILIASILSGCARGSTTMWFNTSNIVPLGNGRLGAQVLGSIPTETIILNEDRIWSGSLNDPNPAGCSAVLPDIREYIWKNDLYNAQATANSYCMATPINQQVYQTAGNLLIFTDHSGTISNYNHTLDLETAVSTTTYVHEGVRYTRTAFATHPDNVIVLRFTADTSRAISFNASFVTPMDNPVYAVSSDSLTMTASGTKMHTLPASIHYNATAVFSASGPLASVGVNPSNSTEIKVSSADEVVVIIAIDTNYNRYNNVSGDPAMKVASSLSAASQKSYEELLEAHVVDHSSLFGRVSISLGTPSSTTYLPTDQRRLLPSGPDGDQDLFALYAQYGRYLAIASSRKTEPSNLQGIWNSQLSPNWGSKYTLNINQQMNSWLAEPLNIPEVLDPLWNLITELAERGEIAAREIYNISHGWVIHHNTDIWRNSAPVDAAFYGFWPMSPAWLMQHMYEHYAFGLDVQFVERKAYPLMKSPSQFYLDFLVVATLEGTDYLVPNPSMSPEHGIGNYNGTNVSLTYGSTIDNSLLRDLFNHTAEFAKMLGLDADFADTLMAACDRLIPFRIGSLGQIQEWAVDYDSNGAFTHISHMYPLFPSAQIDPRFNETLASAANTSLVIRGDSGSGWPTAWRINCYARLLDGEKAYYYLARLLKSFSYANLWSINSIFQIDANFGGANGVAEMLLQSHNGEIHLLPAIPPSWTQGSVTGFRARGGFTVDIFWSGGALKNAMIASTMGRFTRVRYAGSAINLTFAGTGETKALNLASFQN